MDYNYIVDTTVQTYEEEASYKMLGTFWTRIFTQTALVSGYQDGVINDVLDTYQRTQDCYNEQALLTTPAYDVIRWQPVKIYKSKFNKAQFNFEENQAVFGEQPAGDPYQGVTFKFGRPKSSQTLYSYTLDIVGEFTTITDRIIDPTVQYTIGVDILKQNNEIFFTENIFDTLQDQVQPVFSEDGELEDSVLILWIQNFQGDVKRLYRSYGRLLGWFDKTSQNYKKILLSLLGIRVNGPTPDQIIRVFASGMGIPVLVEEGKVTAITYTDTGTIVTVEDIPLFLKRGTPLNPVVKIGAVLPKGTVLQSNLSIKDYGIQGAWWELEPRLIFSNRLFVGTYEGSFVFENKDVSVSYTQDGWDIPVIASDQDKQTWKEYLDRPENTEQLKTFFGLSGYGATTVNMVSKLMEEIYGILAQKVEVNFSTIEEAAYVLNMWNTVSKNVPNFIYFSIDSEQIQADEEISLEGQDQEDSGIMLTKQPPDLVDEELASGNLQDGALITYIPTNATTRSVTNILLVDFL